MKWFISIALVLMLLNGAWMAFDGSRAFLVGDYVTPKTGAYAGQLGPWASLLSALGLDPRSPLVKAVFVLYGLAVVLVSIAYFLQVGWSRGALLALAVIGLWYLPFGTVINMLALVALLVGGE